jgi:hypothetical protein
MEKVRADAGRAQIREEGGDDGRVELGSRICSMAPISLALADQLMLS